MHYQRTVTIGPTLTPMVKYLVLVCAGMFLLQSLGEGREIIYFLGLTPYFVLTKLFIWQLGTYLFLHGGFGHIFFNMLALWMFGSELERYLGSRQFLRFFFITGIGAGVLSVLVDPFSQIPTVGASGAIYGILMAYGMLFPERYVYLYFLFPVKVKYFVAVLGIMAFFAAATAPGSQIAHIAHLGGMVFAFLYLKGLLSIGAIRQAYMRWRVKRMRDRFRVYENEEHKSPRRPRRDDDFWIN